MEAKCAKQQPNEHNFHAISAEMDHDRRMFEDDYETIASKSEGTRECSAKKGTRSLIFATTKVIDTTSSTPTLVHTNNTTSGHSSGVWRRCLLRGSCMFEDGAAVPPNILCWICWIWYPPPPKKARLDCRGEQRPSTMIAVAMA